jgi:P-type conjugative transfer protein TrbJ
MTNLRLKFKAAGKYLGATLAVVAIAQLARAMIVFDPSNFGENVTTAYNSVRQVQTQYQQYATQIKQYMNMVQQAKAMSGESALSLDQASFTNLAAVTKALQAYQELGNSLAQTRTNYERRLDEAKLMAVSWQDYWNYEQQRIATNRDGAAARVQTEVQALQRVDDDYQFARETASKITMTPGLHAAVQQTNAILNRMVTQNAEIMRTLAQANGAQKANEMLEKDAKANAQRSATQRYSDAQNAVSVDPQAAIDALKAAAGKAIQNH